MSSAPVLLAKPWPTDLDPTGWWMSEKLDGVRAYWDGAAFYSRNGNVFTAPAWFTAGLPAEPLDGELWAGRGRFQQTVSAVRKLVSVDAEWFTLRYLVFDRPAAPGPFEDRIAQREISAFAQLVPHARCAGIDHLRASLQAVEGAGGEGLMLRQPGSLYEGKRSDTLLKVKTFHDAEATVTGHLAGNGKHKGRLGALECRTQSGTEFSVGTGFTDLERANPPAVGAVITYRYQELTRDGVPRFPSFVRARTDAGL